MLDVGLKEWAIVCDLLVQGRVSLVLRKGGVFEREGPGRFRLEHDRFALYPAVEHERLDWVKPGLVNERLPLAEEGRVIVRGWAEVAGIFTVVPDASSRCSSASAYRTQFDRLNDLHAWLSPQIDMRFDYKPERPLYAVVLRAYRLASPIELIDREAYQGCRSWVPLESRDAIPDEALASSTPAMGDDQLQSILSRVRQTLAG